MFRSERWRRTLRAGEISVRLHKNLRVGRGLVVSWSRRRRCAAVCEWLKKREEKEKKRRSCCSSSSCSRLWLIIHWGCAAEMNWGRWNKGTGGGRWNYKSLMWELWLNGNFLNWFWRGAQAEPTWRGVVRRLKDSSIPASSPVAHSLPLYLVVELHHQLAASPHLLHSCFILILLSLNSDWLNNNQSWSEFILINHHWSRINQHLSVTVVFFCVRLEQKDRK